MSDENQTVGLAEMISGLRKELEKAQKLVGGSTIRFDVENVDLELKVNVEKVSEDGGKVGVKFWVVNAELGGKGSDKETTTQTIKLSLLAKDLTVLDKDGNPRYARVRG